MNNENASAGIQSIEIELPLLRILAEARAPLALTALAAAVEMPPAGKRSQHARFAMLHTSSPASWARCTAAYAGIYSRYSGDTSVCVISEATYSRSHM